MAHQRMTTSQKRSTRRHLVSHVLRWQNGGSTLTNWQKIQTKYQKWQNMTYIYIYETTSESISLRNEFILNSWNALFVELEIKEMILK